MTAKREFFTTNEVAQTLGISPFTIRRYIRLRMLKAVKLEGSYRVRRTDLNRFLKAREVETEEELDALDAAEPGAATVPPKRAAQPDRVGPPREEDAHRSGADVRPSGADTPEPERTAGARRGGSKRVRSQPPAEPTGPTKKPARKPVKR